MVTTKDEIGDGAMTDWRADANAALETFLMVADLGGVQLKRIELDVEYLDAPHRAPSRLPLDKMAVYGFWGDGGWLKIGKAGPNSGARYTSQHYNPGSAPSTLSASLSKDPRMATVESFDPAVPGEWIRASTHQVNVLLPADQPKELLSLLEAFLQLRLRPRYG